MKEKKLGTNKMRGELSKLFLKLNLCDLFQKQSRFRFVFPTCCWNLGGHPEELIEFKLLTLGSILGTLDLPPVVFFSPRFKPGRTIVKKKNLAEIEGIYNHPKWELITFLVFFLWWILQYLSKATGVFRVRKNTPDSGSPGMQSQGSGPDFAKRKSK